jgi:hypothetical protein
MVRLLLQPDLLVEVAYEELEEAAAERLEQPYPIPTSVSCRAWGPSYVYLDAALRGWCPQRRRAA